MTERPRLDGLVPQALAPKTRKIVLEDYCVPADIGFHEFEIGTPQRLMITVEVWVEEIVAALRFLVATPTITGQTITLDGGQRFLGLARDVQFLET